MSKHGDAPDHEGGPGADRRRAGVTLTIARTLGELLITAGVVVLLLVVYEVYVTDIWGHQKQQAATTQMDQRWAKAEPGDPDPPGGTDVVVVTEPGAATDPGQRKRTYDTVIGQGFAKIYIPAFGADYVFTIIEGTDADDLYIGPGHYTDTQYPGDPGNFAVAGHRVSKGSPFNDLGLLRSCDAIVIETQNDWYVYRVLPMHDEVAGWDPAKHAHCAGVDAQTGAYAGVVGRSIVLPSDYPVVLPVPGVDSTAVPANAEKLITLTTCNPKFSDTQRMIIHGILVKSYPKKAGFLPPAMSEES